MAAEQDQITLSVTAIDDGIKEPEITYAIDLSVAGHATLTTNRIAVTVPVDDRDADIDEADNEVAENSPVGALVGITVQADNATTYTLADDAGGLFAIDSQSGVVTVAIDMLDYEAFSSHDITVRATGDDGAQTTTLVIQVTDQPEPVKPIADIDFTPNKIIYGSAPGAPVGITVRAIDPDRGSVVSYALSENPGGLFAISPQDGVVTLASDSYSPDRDYRIEVTAMSNDGTSSAAQFTVRRDEPLRIAFAPTTATLREGESRDIAFSIAETDPELVAISAGFSHSCGVTSDNEALCWGSDDEGRSSPPPGKLIALSTGEPHNCAITLDNKAVCWGRDSNAQVMPSSPTPAIELGRSVIDDISAGSFHSCAVTRDNRAICWGSEFLDIPITPPSGRKFIAVSAGRWHSCGITVDNEALCWGAAFLGASITPPSDRKYIAVSARQQLQLRHHPRQQGGLLGAG